jgi:hypothetical protein
MSPFGGGVRLIYVSVDQKLNGVVVENDLERGRRPFCSTGRALKLLVNSCRWCTIPADDSVPSQTFTHYYQDNMPLSLECLSWCGARFRRVHIFVVDGVRVMMQTLDRSMSYGLNVEFRMDRRRSIIGEIDTVSAHRDLVARRCSFGEGGYKWQRHGL